MNHTVDSISPFITTVLVNGKQVRNWFSIIFYKPFNLIIFQIQNLFLIQITVGVIGQKETVLDKPMTPREIQNVMYKTIQPYDIIQAVLQQVANDLH